MSLRSSGSETEIKDFIVADYRPEMKSESGMVDDKISEDAPNRLDKQSVFYGCDPEMIPDYNPKRPVYSGPPAEEVGYKSKTEDKQSVFYGYDPEIPDYNYRPKRPLYVPYKSPPAEEVGYKSKTEDKQSVFYGCDPEMIPDYNYPPRRPDYSGDIPYKPLLAQELGLGYNYRNEDFIFKGNVMIGIKCAICEGKHDLFTCKLRERCPFDQKVPEDFEVVCLCCNRTHCTKRSYPIGRVTFKKSSSYLDKKSPKYMLF
ncbi:hypothetical protein CASFOL_009661 [Castilleja foliolosa]|uniref:Uncharacterized protein n=1 Tax=Castilleja foliolosa TaxID=1961234 RepID=A0ABD3DQB7_9LAMI